MFAVVHTPHNKTHKIYADDIGIRSIVCVILFCARYEC